MATEPWDGEDYVKSGSGNAATYINWDDASTFCKMLSKKTGKKVALPTEAQWEHACRANSKTAYCFGDNASKLASYAWYDANTSKKDDAHAHAAGQKESNAFGLYDMHGNVWEWCRDWYDEKFYAKAKNVDPENTTKNHYRVIRGGSWVSDLDECRAASRVRNGPYDDGNHVGFRVVISADSVE